MSLRKLKYHEQKLLKKVDFLQWKRETNMRENEVMRRYYIQKREDYVKYNKIVGKITKLLSQLKLLPVDDEFRMEMTKQLLKKLYDVGIIPTQSTFPHALTVSAICRRRLPVVMVRMKMAQTVKQAVAFVEQGHIRVGPDVVTDSAYLVPRTLEDYVTWVDQSKIRRAIDTYNDEADDFDLMGI